MYDKDTLIEFLEMPLESSDEVFARFLEIPGAIHRGRDLHQFLYIRGKREPKVLLIAHADTFWDVGYGYVESNPKDIIQENGIIRNANGGLGADDRAGCAMIWLLKDLGHSILITSGEEHGRQGSNWLMDENIDIADEINRNHQFMVQLDRKNGTDYKCYEVGTDDFRMYVERTTGYSEPNRCSATDIKVLCRDITGVNLSIGYHGEHTRDEYLVLAEWQHTLKICRDWLAEMQLPKFRLEYRVV